MIIDFIKGPIGDCFNAQFANMKKPQEFLVYRPKPGDTFLVIQSDTRIGTVNLVTGVVKLSRNIPNGAFFIDLGYIVPVDTITADELASLKNAISLA